MPNRYIYAGEGVPVWLDEGEPEPKGVSKEVFAEIFSLWEAGTPFFTKESIRDVYRQLTDSTTSGQKISVRGIDGRMVEVKVWSGLVFSGTGPNREPDLQMVLAEPMICYLSVQSMLSKRDNFIPNTAYCNLRIRHYMDTRNVATNEIVTPPTVPFEEVDELFDSAREVWEAGEPCKRLRYLLASIKLPCKINKIVSFALGSMADPERICHPNAFQHALIWTLRDVLAERGQMSQEAACYTQDPAYNEADKAVLQKLQITVVEDPVGFLEVDDSTIVLSCSPDVPVKQIVMEVARPAMMIWNPVGESGLDDPSYCDPDSPRLKKQVDKFYNNFEFPGDGDMFGSLEIYVRRKARQ